MQHHDYVVPNFAFKTLSIKNIFPRVISNSFEPLISSMLPLNCSFGCSCLFGSSNFQQFYFSINLRFFFAKPVSKGESKS